MNNIVSCKICGKQFKSYSGNFSRHLKEHNITPQEYYDQYFDKTVCQLCGSETPFISITKGYKSTCHTCSWNNGVEKSRITKLNKTAEEKQLINYKRQQTCLERLGYNNAFQQPQIQAKCHSKEIRKRAQDTYKKTMQEKHSVDNYWQTSNAIQKTTTKLAKEKRNYTNYLNYIAITKKQEEYNSQLNYLMLIRNANIDKFEQDNNCISVNKLRTKYGLGWYKASCVNFIYYKKFAFVKYEDIQKIIDYYSSTRRHSKQEANLLQYLKTIYTGSIFSDKYFKDIKLEVDIYIPELKLAIEYNGLYWHSNRRISNNYHLEKSLACRKLGIRLIHIYEFEDINQQKQLLYDLIINHSDKYPINDFNKNNFLDNIPNPEIIYHNDKLIIYGAGYLY